jgi:hypothetical protein
MRFWGETPVPSVLCQWARQTGPQGVRSSSLYRVATDDCVRMQLPHQGGTFGPGLHAGGRPKGAGTGAGDLFGCPPHASAVEAAPHCSPSLEHGQGLVELAFAYVTARMPACSPWEVARYTDRLCRVALHLVFITLLAHALPHASLLEWGATPCLRPFARLTPTARRHRAARAVPAAAHACAPVRESVALRAVDAGEPGVAGEGPAGAPCRFCALLTAWLDNACGVARPRTAGLGTAGSVLRGPRLVE